MIYQHCPMVALDMYPAQTLKYRKKWHKACDNAPAGWWLEAYSSLLARWNTIKYLGEDTP